MARPRTPIGTFGGIYFEPALNGQVRARARFRDDDGQLRRVQATGATQKAAERNLKALLCQRTSHSTGFGELTRDSSFKQLVEVWLEDLDLEGRVAPSTRDLYERNMRKLVMPAFEHYTLREITISKVDRFLKAQANKSYSRAKQAKVVLNLAFGLAVRYEAIPHNPVASRAHARADELSASVLYDSEKRRAILAERAIAHFTRRTHPSEVPLPRGNNRSNADQIHRRDGVAHPVD